MTLRRVRAPGRPGGAGAGSRFDGGLAGQALAAVGLVIVAILSVGLLEGRLPGLPGGPDGNGNGGPARTPTPSDIVIVDPRADVPGILLYAKAGNIWLQRGDEAEQLTDSGRDAMAAFSPDGAWVYFVRTEAETGRWRVNGVARRYRLAVPTLMRIATDGSGPAEALLSGRFTTGDLVWSSFIRQPVISPDGSKAALLTDGPDPTRSNVVLQLLDLTTLALTRVDVPENAPLGHQDPTWSPGGRLLAYVQNARDGSRGAPTIMVYDTTTNTSRALTGPGYSTPDWSYYGRYLAATRTTAFGTDVVIVDGLGAELLRLTTDERSFAPVWSPLSDAIAYLEIDHGITDLWLAPVDITGLPTSDGDRIQLTIAAGLDPGTRPDWWVPPDDIPPPPATPTPAPTAAPDASPSTTVTP